MVDPDYRGNYDNVIPDTEFILAATSEDQVIEAAYIVLIRRITLNFTGTGPIRVRIYDDPARTNLVFDSGNITTAMLTTPPWKDATPRVYVDSSASTYLYLKLDGQIGDAITIGLDVLRLA